MLIKPIALRLHQQGVSLLELIVFIVVVGVASGALFKTLSFSAMHSADPIATVRALELAQSKLDEILAVKYDANTPTGDIPACDSDDPAALVCDNTPDLDMNDIDDYHAISDTPYTGYTRTVTVTTGTDEKLISVAVATPVGTTFTLAAYRANF